MQRIDELIADVRKVGEDLTEIKIILAANTVTLNQNTADVAHHIKRTDLLDDRVARVELPLKSLKWVAGFIVGLAGVIGAIYGLLQLLGGQLPK